MSGTELTATVSAVASLLAALVAVYVARKQRGVMIAVANVERAYRAQRDSAGDLRACAAAAHLIGYRATGLRRLAQLGRPDSSLAAQRVEERFDSFVTAADDFIELWTKVSNGTRALDDLVGLALQLNESVETVRLAWVVRSMASAPSKVGLDRAIDEVASSSHSCAVALHSAAAAVTLT